MLNYYKDTWVLDVPVCPCDAHFLDFLNDRRIKNASIFHFGTGAHHIVGLGTAEGSGKNSVLGITASTGEYDSYIKLAIEKPMVAKRYKVLFGDIYQLDPRLLPQFDVVTLFHLCEFRTDENDAYDALTDLEMAKLLTDKIKPGGWLLFYTGSMAFDKAGPVIAKLAKQRPLDRHPDFKTLQVYRKRKDSAQKPATKAKRTAPKAKGRPAAGAGAKKKS